MKKIYLKPALENIVVTPLCAIQAASGAPGQMTVGYDDTYTPAAGGTSLSKNAKGFDLWD